MADEKKKILLDIELNTDSLVSTVAKAKNEIAKLKEENKKLAAEAKAALESGLVEEYNRLNEAIVRNEVAIASTRTEQSRAENQLKTISLATKATAGSYEELYNQWKLADISLKNLASTLKRNEDGTVELTDEYKRAKIEVEQLKDGLLEFNAGIKDGRLNVGNYTASIIEAAEKTGILGEFMNQGRQALQGIRTGADIAKEGYDLLNKGIDQSIDTVKKWFSVTNSGTFSAETFSSATDGLESVNTGAKAATVSTEVLGDTMVETGVKGSTAMKVLKIAIASTGIGLLLIALGALAAYFTQTEEGAEAIERGFAGVMGVVKVLVGSLISLGKVIVSPFTEGKEALKLINDFIEDTVVKTIKGVIGLFKSLFTLDYAGLKKSLNEIAGGYVNVAKGVVNAGTAVGNYGKKLYDSAKAASELKAKEQDLEDAIRNSTAQIEKNKTAIEQLKEASKDKNKPDEERIQLLRQAIELEKQNLGIQVDLANREKKIQEERVAQLEKLGQARDEDYQKLVDAEANVERIIQENTRKRSELKAQESELSKKIVAENLKITLDGYAQELKLLELQGQDTTELKRKIAQRERDLKLAEADPKEVGVIKKDFEVRMAEIEKEGQEARRKLFEQEQDIRISMISDGLTRELTELAVSTQRKLEAIKSEGEEANKLRLAIEEEAGQKAIEIQERYRLEGLEKRREVSQQNLNIRQSELDAEFVQLSRAIEENSRRELALRVDALKSGEITQAQFAESELQIEQEKSDALVQLEILRLEKQLELELQFQAERQQQDEVFYQEQKALIEQKLIDGTISNETFQADLLRLQQENGLRQIQTELDTQTAINATVAKLQEERVKVTTTTENRIVDTKKKSAAAQAKINEEVVKNSASAINELSDLLSQDEKRRKKYGEVLKALAVADIVINTEQEISGYWVGVGQDASKTGWIGGAVSTAIAVVRTAIAVARAVAAVNKIMSTQYAEGGFTGDGKVLPFPTAVAKYKPQFLGSFGGGYVNKATMVPAYNVYGERRREYVAPDWQLDRAPHIFAGLERWRTTKVYPFEDGGYTGSIASAPAISMETIVNGFADAVASLPPGVVTVEDINAGQTRVEVRESRASF